MAAQARVTEIQLFEPRNDYEALMQEYLAIVPEDHPLYIFVDSLEFKEDENTPGIVNVNAEIVWALTEGCFEAYKNRAGETPINYELVGMLKSVAALIDSGETEAAKKLCAQLHLDMERGDIGNAFQFLPDLKTMFKVYKLACKVWPPQNKKHLKSGAALVS